MVQMSAEVKFLGAGQGKRGMGALIAYALSKASVLIAPLLLSAVLPLSQYGLVELSLSVGQLCAGLLAAGLPSSLSYLTLKRAQPRYLPAFYFHVIVTAVLCLVASVVAYFFDFVLFRAAALVSGIVVSQFIASEKYRASGRAAASSLAESTLYLQVLIFGAAAYANWLPRTLPGLNFTLSCGLASILCWNAVAFRGMTSRAQLWRIYRVALGYGIRTVPASVATVGLSSFGRVLVGIVGSASQVAIYSLVYRLCAPIVAIHQFLTNLFFTKLYTGQVKDFERYFAALTVALCLAGAMSVIVGPLLAYRLIGANALAIERQPALFALMAMVMILWSQLSLMELFMNREAKLLVQLPGLLAGCALALTPFVFRTWRGADQVANVALFQGLGLALGVAWQFRKSGHAAPVWRVPRALVLGESTVMVLVWLVIALR